MEEQPEVKPKTYACTECGQIFRLGSSMRQHRKRKHRDQEVFYYCYYCPYKSKTNKSNLAVHIDRMHMRERENQRNPPPPNVCGLCYAFECPAADRGTMIDHFKSRHDVVINEVVMSFNSWEEFLAWKRETESKENAKYVNRVGTQRRKTLQIVHYFRCCRDGIWVSKGTGKRKPRVKGSIRSGTMCPASMRAIRNLDDGAVSVIYIDRHVGHSSEVGKTFFTKEQKDEIASMNLSTEEKGEIASKLSAGVSIDTIMDSVRESICKTQLKLSHGRPKDVWNVRNTLHLQKGFMQRPDDRTSVEAWLAALDNYSDIVRFYKAQFSELPFHPELNYVDFILIMAFDTQIDLLRRFGHDCVCFDGTHGANGYAFELTTLLIKDDKKEGLPCAFMISSRCDSDIMSLFVRVVKDLLVIKLTPQVLMSDTSDVCYNAWCSWMPQPSRWLYSAWHVDQKWKQSLNMVSDSTKRCAIYKLLRILIDEPDENAFSVTLAKALATLFDDSELRNFADFFYKEYGAHLERWAHCYGKYSGTNTKVFLEPMLKILKHFYLNGKKTKGLDKGLDSLLRYTRDRLVALKKSIPTTPNLAPITERHDRSINLKNTIVANENGWLIPSETKPYVYQVTKRNVICDCLQRCELCHICKHEYTCTCDDSKESICKHVHRIVTHSRNQTPPSQPAVINVITGSASQEICEEEPYIADDAEYVDEGSISYFLSTGNQTVNNSNTQLEGMRRVLLRDFTRLLDSSNNCADLEAIGKALRPLVPTIVRPSRAQK